jgi:CRP/FNR family nitrogen fixation transcriptional regulator
MFDPSAFQRTSPPPRARLAYSPGGKGFAQMPQAVAFHPAGAEIYGQGDVVRDLYQVEFGAVRVCRLLVDGRRQVSAFHLPGEIFGFEVHGTHHLFAEAMIASGIRILHLAADAENAREILPLALRGLAMAQEHFLVLGRQTAIERVAAFLVDMAERQGELNQIHLPMLRMDIGDYLGLTIETVSRTFSKLREDGIIRLPNSRSVEILNWKALRRVTAASM